MKPSIALFSGDPAGIGPELIARLLADGSACRAANILLVGSQESIDDGMRAAGCRFTYRVGIPEPGRDVDLDEPMLVKGPTLAATGFQRGVVTREAGRYMLDSLAFAIGLWRAGVAGALCFAPLNKAALRAGGMDHPDELHWFCEVLDFHGASVELNVLEGLWTSRVTSHVPLSEVARLINKEAVAQMIELITGSLQSAGIARPRIAVCGLNPHNGDGGAYGREEIDVIEPGVALARARGFAADGPFPADTIFVRATRKDGGYDGVVTMYHDQGQIAMKLLGFERGVTVQGGLPLPITTPAHGTAYDIAGLGKAHPGAMKNAFALACRMAANTPQEGARTAAAA